MFVLMTFPEITLTESWSSESVVISWRMFEGAVHGGPRSECDPLVRTVFNKQNKLTAVQAF